MRRITWALVVVVAAIGTGSGVAAPGVEKTVTKAAPGAQKAVTKAAPVVPREVVNAAGQMQFHEISQGVLKSVLWGDPAKGAYATITKFALGQKNPLHTHTHDLKIVVISGTFVYDSGSGEKRLGPGSYLLIPGGAKHTSGAGLESQCVFFEESDGAFDLKPLK